MSQSDLPPEESTEEDQEEEKVEDYATKEISSRNYSSSPGTEVVATAMEEYSSSYLNDQPEPPSNLVGLPLLIFLFHKPVYSAGNCKHLVVIVLSSL